MSLRQVFLETAALVRPLLDHPTLTDRWDEPSALELMTVGEVAAHLTRAVTTVQRYLDEPIPHTPLLDAPGYLTSVDGLADDITTSLHRQIRERAAIEARGGPTLVRTTWDEALERLTTRLAGEPPDRRIGVFGGRAMLLDQYLVTRILELVVHGDDLATSLALPPPAFDPPITGVVIDCLLEVARRRHGDLAVVRAFTRRERDTSEALRVL